MKTLANKTLIPSGSFGILLHCSAPFNTTLSSLHSMISPDPAIKEI